MASVQETYDVVNDRNAGGFSGMGGGGLIIILLLVFAFLFKDRHGNHSAGSCEHQGRPWLPDESNWQLETHDLRDKWAHDVRALQSANKTDEHVHAEGDKTRALIHAEAEKTLRDRLADKDREIQTLHLKGYTDARFDGLSRQIGELACGLPTAPPQYFSTRQNCTAPPPRCDVGRGCGCGGDFV